MALHYSSSLKALEDEGLGSKPDLKSEIKNLKTDLANDHLRKMLNMMYDEQSRTEELLTNRYGIIHANLANFRVSPSH